MFEIVADSSRQLIAAGVLLSYCACCIGSWRGYRAKQRSISHATGDRLIVWASQSGNAQQLAQQLQQQLSQAGKPAGCLALEQLSSSLLQKSTEIIFIVSTFGEGEAPEHARLFLKKLAVDCSLQHLKIHVLGLGDRRYPEFCKFAEQLQARLIAQGATLSLPLMTVDNMQAEQLAHWQQCIAAHFAIDAIAANQYQPSWFHATLLERQHLNPYSNSPGLYKLRFQTACCDWQAGDTVRVHPFNNPAFSTREYSIASSAASGYLELIVRLNYDAKQTPGQCSGWLCTALNINDSIVFSRCTKPNFHATAHDKPAIFIGAGSGLAGLRAHLAERPKLSQNWLILGERCPRTDRLLPEELQQWQRRQHLTYLDYAFSRDTNTPRYVQDCLVEQQQRLISWIEQGATIYVCGRLQGMGRGVLQTLTQLLGTEQMQNLQQQGRYRTDLY